MTRTLHTLAAAAALCLAAAGTAQAAPVTFTKLTGLTGDSPAGTAVFKADLSAANEAAGLTEAGEDDGLPPCGSPEAHALYRTWLAPYWLSRGITDDEPEGEQLALPIGGEGERHAR